jgi:hypothetical protein
MLTQKRNSSVTTVPKGKWGVDSKPWSKRSKNWQVVTGSVTGGGGDKKNGMPHPQGRVASNKTNESYCAAAEN